MDFTTNNTTGDTMRVLLIVDPQNDFCPGGSLAVKDGDQIIPTVNALMRSGEYDRIVVSQDFHPKGHVSFVDNHPGGELFSIVQTAKGEQILWPRHCEQGTHGASFHPDLDMSRVDHIVQKGMSVDVDSYSAFFDNAKLNDTGLKSYLEGEAIKRGETIEQIEVDVCGLALDYCVKATARDAAQLGMKTSVIIDACRAVDQSLKNELTLLREEFPANNIRPIDSSEILPQPLREREHHASRLPELRP